MPHRGFAVLSTVHDQRAPGSIPEKLLFSSCASFSPFFPFSIIITQTVQITDYPFDLCTADRRAVATTTGVDRLYRIEYKLWVGRLMRAPQKATPITLRMQAQTAARFEDVSAHVTFTGTGGKDSRLVPLWDQTRIWDPGD